VADGAGERLRYFHERVMRAGSQTVKEDGLWEEYRYDPLGRRVLVNTRTASLCRTQSAFQCASATTRMIWSGDQLLWEIRRSSESPGETSGPTDAYGTVSYTHGGGLDRPLVITKNGQSILPHQNWRGQFSRGTYANGASSDCAPRQTSGCQRIPWPGWRTTAWHFEVQEPTISVWFGGLVDDMRDATGQMYKRNRYYDPATGQFTQQDPIGLVGGLNTYGFGNGDPVSYSDPYGLATETGCPPICNDSNPRHAELEADYASSASSKERAVAVGLLGTVVGIPLIARAATAVLGRLGFGVAGAAPAAVAGTRTLLREGDALLGIVHEGRLIAHTSNVTLGHVQFVERTVGSLPVGAEAVTIGKFDGVLTVIRSQAIHDRALPASAAAYEAVKALFR
jgi:RHS repeat-associated protein